MTEFDSRVVFGWIPEIGTCWPNKREDKNHRATGISIEVRHFIKILLCSQLCEKNIEYIDTTLNEVIVYSNDDFLAFLSQPLEILLEQIFHLIYHVDNVRSYHSFFLSLLFETNRPSLHYRLPTQMNWLKIDHTTSWHSCWWCNGQIIDFEELRHSCRQLDTLTIG